VYKFLIEVLRRVIPGETQHFLQNLFRNYYSSDFL